MSTMLAMDALRDAVAGLPDDRLSATRRAALDHLGATGTPTTRHEDWKYTDLSSVVDISNQWLATGARAASVPVGADVIRSVTRRLDANWLVIANGRIDAESVAAIGAGGVTATLLSESESTPEFAAPLCDLNVALLHDGLRIEIGDNANPAEPIGILVVDSAATVGVSQVRVEIVMHANSEASFIEYHASTGSAEYYTNSVVTLGLGNNAGASYVRIQDRALGHSQTARLDVVQGRDSRFRHSAFDLGGKLVRNDLHVRLAAPGASASIDGLYLADSEQHIDNHVRVDHEVGPTASNQEYRGILGGAARCVWNGKAIVHAGADGADAEQANHNLLLSDKAEVDAKPELEIYADEVKCSHGTTIGQLDENALFYLRTRGLDRREAKQLLTRAFAQRTVTRTPIEAHIESIAEQVADRLQELSQGDAA